MQTATTLLSTLLAAGLLGTVPATLADHGKAQDEAPAATAATEEFVLEAGQHSIIDLIDRSADFLGRNYLYSEADVANSPDNKVKLQHRMVLDAQGCEEVISQLAYSRGFAMIPIDPERGIYEWVYRQGPKRMELSTRAPYVSPDEVVARRRLQHYVTTSVALQHINATAAQNQMRPFYLAGGSSAAGMSFGVAGQSILIQGFAEQVASAVELLRKIDVPPTEGQLERSWKEQIEARLRKLEKAVREK